MANRPGTRAPHGLHRIVVAVDGSKHSDRAVELAATLAEPFGATLFLVHAFQRTSNLIGYESAEERVARRGLAGQAVLDRAHEMLGDLGEQVQEELLEGPPADAILAVASTRHADLIVMGTRGLGDLGGLLLGSVSHKVIHSSVCPVLVAR
jgi:nucleotide-binding universal stress UspA family protein